MAYRKWMQIKEGESVILPPEEASRARKIAHYWSKKAKRPRFVTCRRTANGQYIFTRLTQKEHQWENLYSHQMS